MYGVKQEPVRNEVQFPKETLTKPRYENVTQTEVRYTIEDALVQSDNLLGELVARIARLRNKIEPVLETFPECDENPAPRIGGSPLMNRIQIQNQLLESLNRDVEKMIGSVAL